MPKAGGRGGAAREPRVPAAAHTCRDVRTNKAVSTERGEMDVSPSRVRKAWEQTGRLRLQGLCLEPSGTAY